MSISVEGHSTTEDVPEFPQIINITSACLDTRELNTVLDLVENLFPIGTVVTFVGNPVYDYDLHHYKIKKEVTN